MLTCSRSEAHSHMEEHSVTLHGYKLLTRTDNVNIFSQQRGSPVDWTTEAMKDASNVESCVHWSRLTWKLFSPNSISFLLSFFWKEIRFLHSTADNLGKDCTSAPTHDYVLTHRHLFSHNGRTKFHYQRNETTKFKGLTVLPLYYRPQTVYPNLRHWTQRAKGTEWLGPTKQTLQANRGCETSSKVCYNYLTTSLQAQRPTDSMQEGKETNYRARSSRAMSCRSSVFPSLHCSPTVI